MEKYWFFYRKKQLLGDLYRRIVSYKLIKYDRLNLSIVILVNISII
jgi:hypothetical protein